MRTIVLKIEPILNRDVLRKRRTLVCKKVVKCIYGGISYPKEVCDSILLEVKYKKLNKTIKIHLTNTMDWFTEFDYIYYFEGEEITLSIDIEDEELTRVILKEVSEILTGECDYESL